MSRNNLINISILFLFLTFVIFYCLNKNNYILENYKFKNFDQLLTLLNKKDIIFKTSFENNKILMINFKTENYEKNEKISAIISLFKNNLLEVNHLKFKIYNIKIDKKNWIINFKIKKYNKNNCKLNGVFDFSENKSMINKVNKNIKINFNLSSKSNFNKCNIKLKKELNYPNYNHKYQKNNYLFVNYFILIFNLIMFINFYFKIKNNLRNGNYYSNLFILFFSSFFIIECFNNFILSNNLKNDFYKINILCMLNFIIYCFIIWKLISFFIEFNINKWRNLNLESNQIKISLIKYYLFNYFIFIILIILGVLFYDSSFYFIFYFSIYFLQIIKLWKTNTIFISDQKIIFLIYISKIFNLYYFNINSNNLFFKKTDINCFFICIIFIISQYFLLNLQLLFGGNFIKGFLNKNDGLGKYFLNKINLNEELEIICSICIEKLKEDNVNYDNQNKLLDSKIISNIYKNKNKFVFKTECNHYFHISCMLTNLSFKNICPNCKTNIKDFDI